jgi:hypothetical protein
MTAASFLARTWCHRRAPAGAQLMLAASLGLAIGCSSPTSLTMCPKPAFQLVPFADTVSPGGITHFSAGSAAHGALRWARSNRLVAYVDNNGLATGITQGSADLIVDDVDAPANCPTKWYGRLMVR